MIASKISTPVDLLYREQKILVRRLPGFADLNCRKSEPAAFDLRGEIESLRRGLADDTLPPFTILKARPAEPGDSNTSRARCKARFDVGLGPRADFVVLDIEGHWLRNGPSAYIVDAAKQFRKRLDRFRWDKPWHCQPSLCYESGDHPRAVQFELTTHCNLRCGYCNNRLLTEKNHAPLPNVLRILDAVDFTQINIVDLTGLGEALLHPALDQIIADIRRRGAPEINLVTNGTVLTVERCRRLIAAGVTGISISFDTLDPVRFNAARVGGKFAVIKQNIVAVARFRDSGAVRPFGLSLKSVLLEENPYEQADTILQFSAEHHLDAPCFSVLDPREPSVAHYEPGIELRLAEKHARQRIVKRLSRRWTELTNGSNGSNGAASPSPAEGTLPWKHRRLEEHWNEACDWAVDSAYIGGDGYCIACCQHMGDLPRSRVSSVFEKSLASLWNDELLYHHRLPLSLGWVPQFCQGCYLAPANGKPLVATS